MQDIVHELKESVECLKQFNKKSTNEKKPPVEYQKTQSPQPGPSQKQLKRNISEERAYSPAASTSSVGAESTWSLSSNSDSETENVSVV